MNIKEKWNNYKTWKKTKIDELHEKHPKIADALVTTQIIIGATAVTAFTYAIGYNDGQIALSNKIIDEVDKEKRQGPPEMEPWKEEYRENYEKAIKFGESISMTKGEEFVISDSSVYNDPTMKSCIVDHYINGKPCYPPEEIIEWVDQYNGEK